MSGVIHLNKKFLPLFFIIMVLSVSSVSALTVLSLDRVDIQSNSAQISGEQWVLDVVLDQLNDKIEGYVNSEDITTDGTYAQNDLYLDAEVTHKACTYDIQANGNIIYTVYQTQMGGWPFNDESECFDSGGWIYSKESGEINGRCIYRTVKAQSAYVDFDRYEYEADLSLTINGQTESARINNFDNPDVQLGSRAHADWIGNLVSGDSCEDARDKGVVAAMQSSGNILTGESQLNSYVSYYTNFYSQVTAMLACQADIFCSTDQTTQTLVNTFNQYANSALAPKVFRSSQGSVAYVSGNDVRIDLERAIQFPNLRLRVKADWLGIYIPVGEPDIVHIDTDDFMEGTTGQMRVTVRNTGDAQGSFSLSAVCQDNIQVVGGVNIFNLNPGQSSIKTLSLQSIRDVTSRETDRCTVTLEERNSGDTDTASVTIGVLQQTFCTSGETKCESEQAFKCSSDGQWVRDSGNDAECSVACSTDLDCDDNDGDTIDTCESDGFLGGKVCKHVLDPNVARIQCEADGGKFIEKESNPPFWKFWENSETTYVCLHPHVSILGVSLLVIGIIGIVLTLTLLGGMPPMLFISILVAVAGLVLTILGGIGYV